MKCSEILHEKIGDSKTVAIEIHTKSLCKTSIFVSIYVPSKAWVCPDIFHKLWKLDKKCIILDGLNAALQLIELWKTNEKGRQLQGLLEEGYSYS